MTPPFTLNEDYTVWPDTNTVCSSIKIEPRLMKLLCFFAARPGTLITREEIVEKLWNGYDGGDEGLTQAVSNLRKILNDVDKTMIETVPKGGYLFKGRVMIIEPSARQHGSADRNGYISYKTAVIIAVILILIFGLVLLGSLSQQNNAPEAPRRTPTDQSAPKSL